MFRKIYVILSATLMLSCRHSGNVPSPRDAEMLVRKHYMHTDNRDSDQTYSVQRITIDSIVRLKNQSVRIVALIEGNRISTDKQTGPAFKDRVSLEFQNKGHKWEEVLR